MILRCGAAVMALADAQAILFAHYTLAPWCADKRPRTPRPGGVMAADPGVCHALARPAAPGGEGGAGSDGLNRRDGRAARASPPPSESLP